MIQKKPLVIVHTAQHTIRPAGNHVDRPPKRIRPPQYRLGPSDNLDVIHLAWINRVEILIGAETEDAVVEPNAINQKDGLGAGEAAEERRSLTSPCALHKYAHFALNSLDHVQRLPATQRFEIEYRGVPWVILSRAARSQGTCCPIKRGSRRPG